MHVNDLDLVADNDVHSGEVTHVFRDRDFRNANFSRSDLKQSDFTNSNLQNARLSQANLEGSKFRTTRLEGADLSEARLHGADLSGAWLNGADLSSVRIWKAQIKLRLKSHFTNYTDLITGELYPEELAEFEQTLKDFEQKQNDMRAGQAPGYERVVKAFERFKERLGPILRKQPLNEEEKAQQKMWDQLAQCPLPDGIARTEYLAELACRDTTEKAYVAQGVLRQILDEEFLEATPAGPAAFLKKFEVCPAYKKLPETLRIKLRAAASKGRTRLEMIKAKVSRISTPKVAKDYPAVCRFDEFGNPLKRDAKPSKPGSKQPD